MTVDELIENERTLSRFHRLVRELARGAVVQNTFQPWEIELLLDIEACVLEPKVRNETLRRYQKAVERQLEQGPGPPMKLSTFLQTRSTRRPSMT
jgi:hypothetical protein